MSAILSRIPSPFSPLALSLPYPSLPIFVTVVFLSQYGRTYERRMMQGTLRYQSQQGSCHREISQRQISSMLRKVAPSAHNEKAHDLLDKTNPVSYYAPYFGYKLHMDQNEKLAQESPMSMLWMAVVGWFLDL